MTTIAFFVSPHGFGHAARASAVVNALTAARPALHSHLFTTVPQWFFAESVDGRHHYHSCESDVGLVQISALHHDTDATVRRLRGSPWADEAEIDRLARRVSDLGCGLVLADIAPLGLRVARRAGLPAVLIESFSWRWIYDRLVDASPELRRLGRRMDEDGEAVDLHLQARPCCELRPSAVPIPVVARAPRRSRTAVRQLLGVPEDEPMVLASMGGVQWRFSGLERLTVERRRVWIVVPGGSDAVRRRGRVISLPFHGPAYHPDLVRSADVVVGKLGYSTLAEAAAAGSAFAFVARPGFPESPVLARFAADHLDARELDPEAFGSGDWMPMVESLVAARSGRPALRADGAAAAAAAILDTFPEVFA